jgi:hypothetical protein
MLLPLASLLLTVAPALAPKQEAAMPRYFPAGPSVGARWDYLEGGFGGRELLSYFVTGVEQRGGVTAVSLGVWEGERIRPRQTLAVSADGLFLTEWCGRPLDRPLCLLKLPHRHGQSWPVAGDEYGERFAGVRTAYGPEQVRVRGTTYSAIRVETTIVIDGRAAGILEKAWYAPDLGLVDLDRGEGSVIKVLMAYTSNGL